MFEVLPFDRHAVAARLRELLLPGNESDLRVVAAHLGISELTLSLSVDRGSPHPGFETIGAVVRVYGVDPHWLITGEYDANVHRAAVEAAERGAARELEELLRRQVTALPPEAQGRENTAEVQRPIETSVDARDGKSSRTSSISVDISAASVGSGAAIPSPFTDTSTTARRAG